MKPSRVEALAAHQPAPLPTRCTLLFFCLLGSIHTATSDSEDDGYVAATGSYVSETLISTSQASESTRVMSDDERDGYDRDPSLASEDHSANNTATSASATAVGYRLRGDTVWERLPITVDDATSASKAKASASVGQGSEGEGQVGLGHGGQGQRGIRRNSSARKGSVYDGFGASNSGGAVAETVFAGEGGEESEYVEDNYTSAGGAAAGDVGAGDVGAGGGDIVDNQAAAEATHTITAANATSAPRSITRSRKPSVYLGFEDDDDDEGTRL